MQTNTHTHTQPIFFHMTLLTVEGIIQIADWNGTTITGIDNINFFY